MNCEMVCCQVDDYLENKLGRRERQRLEMHLTLCSECSDELRQRPAFDHMMWRALATSVQHLSLPSGVSSRIVHTSQGSAQRGVWSRRTALTLQVMAGALVVVLVLFGALVLFDHVNPPAEMPSFTQPSTSRPALSVTQNDILVEPHTLRPGRPFTTTIFLHSDLSEPVDAVRFKLHIDGPTGDYDFALALQGPFPAQGVSVLRVTPELLAGPCRDQYQISPSDIVRVPGVYTFRATLQSPVIMPEQ